MDYALNLLIKEQVLFERALRKAIEAFEEGRITREKFLKYAGNIRPKIENLKTSINKLR